ncbi:MAG: HNH endonuclease [Methanomicrobiales archaeon]|nr:HNH endonuclease [Methanomicrobiales archaeon]
MQAQVEDVQLPISSFDRSQPPLCHGRPDENAVVGLCIRCPFADRSGHTLRCTRFPRAVTARQKYHLTAWKKRRTAILLRDGCRCTVCGAQDTLHVHHIDSDATNDHDRNLVTLCGICHAKAHAGMQETAGAARIRSVLHGRTGKKRIRSVLQLNAEHGTDQKPDHEGERGDADADRCHLSKPSFETEVFGDGEIEGKDRDDAERDHDCHQEGKNVRGDQQERQHQQHHGCHIGAPRVE